MSSFFRPLFAFFSTVLVGITSYVSICAGGDWDWFESNSSFAPEAYVQDKSYEQLFYSINMFYGEDWYDNAHSNRFKESIIADWKTYLGKKSAFFGLLVILLKQKRGYLQKTIL